MKTSIFRSIFFTTLCFLIVSLHGGALLWALSESPEPTVEYLFETIEVPGVDFLELTSSNDLGHYAGNTRDTDGESMIGFTLIDGLLSTYTVPDSLTLRLLWTQQCGTGCGFLSGCE